MEDEFSKREYGSEDIYFYNVHRPAHTILQLQRKYDIFNTLKDQVIWDIFQKHGYTVTNIKRNENNYGTGHVIYFVETDKGEFVYRGNIWLPDPEYYMSLEKQFTALAEKAHFPTWKIVAADSSRKEYDFDYQIMEILPGACLKTEWTWTKEQYDALSYDLGWFATLAYDMPVKGWGRFKNDTTRLQGSKNIPFEYLSAYLDYDLAVIKKYNVFSEHACTRIEDYFKSVKPIINEQQQSYLIHHDMVDHNVRYSKDLFKVLAIYDWENAVAFDPIASFNTLTWQCHHPRWDMMKKWFRDKLWYTPKYFDKKIAIYILRTMLWKLSFALKGERFNEKHKKLMNTAFEMNDLQIDWPYKDIGTEII